MIVNPARFEFWSVPEENRYECVQIDGSAIPSSKRFSPKIQTFQLREGAGENLYLKRFFPSTDDGIKRLIQSMASAPASEKHFWAIELPVGQIASWSPGMHHLTAITSMFGPVNRFVKMLKNPYPPHEPQFLIVPSFTILKNFLTIALPDTNYTAQPALGVFSKEDIIENKRRGIRLTNIGMPGADNPSVADGQYTGKYVFGVHDWYHWLRDSMIPKRYHEGIKRIETIFRERVKDASLDPSVKEQLEQIIWELYDNEIFGFKMEGEEGAIISRFGAVFEKDNWTENTIDIVIQDMVANKQIWDSIGIGYVDLNVKEQGKYLANTDQFILAKI